VFLIYLVFCVAVDCERVSYLFSFLWCGRKGSVFLIYLVFCVAVDGERVSYLFSFLWCGRNGSVFVIFLVFCVVVGWGACFHRKLRR
jgi:hypothetical protein